MYINQEDFAPSDESATDFWEGKLSPRALAAVKRKGGSRTILERAVENEIAALIELARAELDLASTDAVYRMLAKNPDLVQVVRDRAEGPAQGIFALLPLNDYGAALVASGQFDGTQPDPAWIVAPGEHPAALYEWLFFGPNLYFRTLHAIGELYQMLAPQGCAVFSRGSTEVSAKLLLKLGFMPAPSLYPQARADMVVLVPSIRSETLPSPRKHTEIRLARTFEDLAHVYSIRSAVYLAEQFPLYAEEFDGNDFCATHLIGYVDGDPAGAVRLRYFADFAKCERLAVKMEYRTSRLAFRLIKEATAHVRKKGYTRVYGHASDEVAPFWRMMGARDMPGRPKFRFANIEYREMLAEFEPDPLAIKLGVPPLMTIRPEGRWDMPGALDWSNVADDPAKKKLLAQYDSVRNR